MPRTACECILFGEHYQASSIRDAARHFVDEIYRRFPVELREEAKRATWLGSRGERYDHRVAVGLYAAGRDRHLMLRRVRFVSTAGRTLGTPTASGRPRL